MKKISQNIFSIIMGLLIIGSSFISKSNLMATLGFILVLGLCYLTVNKFKIKKFDIFIFILSMVIKTILISIYPMEQTSDFKVLLDASYSVTNNDFSFLNTEYFTLWSYQIPFVLYQSLILKLFNSVFVLKLLNVIYSSISTVLLYKIAKEISSDKSSKFVSLLYLFSLIPLLLCTYLSNQHLSCMLSYLAIYIYLKDKDNIKKIIICGVLLSLANLIRPESILIILSIICLFVFNVIFKYDSNIKTNLKKIIIIIGMYFITSFLVTSSIKIIFSDIKSIENKDPLWKFTLGLDKDSCGTYNDLDLVYLNDKDAEIELLKSRIEPKYLFELESCKINNYWFLNGLEFKENKVNDINLLGINIKVLDIKDTAISYSKISQIFVLMLCFIGIMNKNNLKNNYYKFLLLLFLINIGVYLFIEIQVRYIYFILVTLYILSSKGIDNVRGIKYEKKNIKLFR